MGEEQDRQFVLVNFLAICPRENRDVQCLEARITMRTREICYEEAVQRNVIPISKSNIDDNAHINDAGKVQKAERFPQIVNLRARLSAKKDFEVESLDSRELHKGVRKPGHPREAAVLKRQSQSHQGLYRLERIQRAAKVQRNMLGIFDRHRLQLVTKFDWKVD